MIKVIKRLFHKQDSAPVAVNDKIDIVVPMKKKTSTRSKKKGK